MLKAMGRANVGFPWTPEQHSIYNRCLLGDFQDEDEGEQEEDEDLVAKAEKEFFEVIEQEKKVREGAEAQKAMEYGDKIDRGKVGMLCRGEQIMQ